MADADPITIMISTTDIHNLRDTDAKPIWLYNDQEVIFQLDDDAAKEYAFAATPIELPDIAGVQNALKGKLDLPASGGGSSVSTTMGSNAGKIPLTPVYLAFTQTSNGNSYKHDPLIGGLGLR